MSTRTIFTVIGTVVGAYFGYPGLGAAVGGLIGGLLTPPVEGPKLSDLKANKVDYGSVIPFVEGHPRFAPILVWQGTKKEVENVEGDECGGGAANYTYVSDCLWLLAENRVGPIRKAWYNSKLCYNVSTDANDETIEASLENPKWSDLIYHDGTSDQAPDETYEAALGDVPAFRGCTTMMTKDFALLGSEGIMPLFTVEPSGQPTGDQSIGVTKQIQHNWAEADYRGTPPEGSMYGGLAVTAIMAQGIRTYYADGNIATNPLPTGVNVSQPGRGNGNRAISVFGVDEGNCVFGFGGDGIETKVIAVAPGIDMAQPKLGTDTIVFSVFNDSIAVGTTIPYGEGILLNGEGHQESAGSIGFVWIYNLDGTFDAKVDIHANITTLNSVAVNESTLWALGNGVMLEFDRSSDLELKLIFAPPGGTGHRIFSAGNGVLVCSNDAAEFYRWLNEEWVQFAVLADAVDFDQNPVDLGTADADHSVRGFAAFAAKTVRTTVAPEGKEVTYFVNSANSQEDPNNWRKTFDEVVYEYGVINGASTPDGRLGWAVSGTYGSGYPNMRAARYMGYTIGSNTPWPYPDSVSREIHATVHRLNLYGYPGDDIYPGKAYIMQDVALTIYQYTRQLAPGEEDPSFYIDQYRKRLDVDLVDLTEPTLEDVTRRQCLRGGLEESDLDFTDLATRNVRAMAVSQIVSPDSVLDTLTSAFFYNFKESEKLVGEFLGKDVVATIPYDDLGADGEEPFEKAKINDLELASQSLITYMNVDDDYQNDTQASDRLVSVGESIRTREIAIGFTPTEAKRIAYSDVLIPAIGKLSGTIALNRKYSRLQAGDAVRIFDEDGSSYRVRFMKCVYERGIYKFDWVIDDERAYTSSAVAPGHYTNSTIVNPAPATLFEIVDTKLIDDSLDGPNVLVAAKGERNPWPGAAMQRSPDGFSYNKLYDSTKKAVLGTCTTALEIYQGQNQVDSINSVRVSVGEGVLLSALMDTVMQSKTNLAMVGDTLLQFVRATMVSAGVYDLSGLIYHTNPEDATHVVGERFVLMSVDRLDKLSMSLADFGISKYYREVTFDQPVTRATVKEFAPQFIALKPLMPVNLRALTRLNGSISIFWDRRSRLATNCLRGIVPLGEASELYSIRIYDGATLKETYTSNGELLTWPSADIVSQFPSGGTATIKVNQIGQLPGYEAVITKEI